MKNKKNAMVLVALFLSIGILQCATARPDPSKISDNNHVITELGSAGSTLKVQILQGNLHEDLAFYPNNSGLYYRVLQKDSQVLHWSPLGLKAAGYDFSSNVKVGKFTSSVFKHKYSLAHGKKINIEKTAEKFTAMLTNTLGQILALEFILQEDAVAFRYVAPVTANPQGTIRVEKDLTGFRLPEKTVGYMQEQQEASQVSPAYEYYFEKVKAGKSDSGKASIRKIWQPIVGFTGLIIFGSDGWAFPALFRTPEEKYVFITEAGTSENNSAMHMTPDPDNNLYTLEFPSQKEANGLGESIAHSSLPMATSYRVIVCCSLKAVAETTAVTDFAQPLDERFKGKMPAWVKPGKSTWDWLSYLSTGDMARQKRYIDAAKEFGWQYTLVDANWNKWNSNNPEPLIKELVQYAGDKGISLWLWYNSGGPNNKITEEPRDLMTDPVIRKREFAKLKEWGIKGVKIDFWSSDKQFIIKQYLDTLGDAADHGIMVNFHGSTMPRGWQRRFPNLMTMESVKGAEWYQFPVFRGPNAFDNVYYAYTRNVAGPMDYTPIVFEQAFKQQDITYSHSLALSVVFESGIQHFADNADDPTKGFRKVFGLFPFAKDFLKSVPVRWNTTLLLDGSPDTHVILARQSGTTWYVGAISSSKNELVIKQKFSFLGKGKYTWERISEGNTGDTLQVSQGEIQPDNEISLKLHPKGGFVMKISPLGEKGPK